MTFMKYKNFESDSEPKKLFQGKQRDDSEAK